MIKASVIIPTKNRYKCLERLLFALSQQTAKPNEYEIIVFDNGSKDSTVNICNKYSGKIQNLVYQYDAIPGLHRGRNWGYQNAKGEIVVYLDDDVIPETNTYLSRIIEQFDDKSIAMLVGSIKPNFESQPPNWISRLWEKNGIYNTLTDFSCVEICANDGDDISPYYAFGANFIIRKSVLNECAGFHPDGMPKDLLMYRGDGETYVANYIVKHNLRVAFCKEASVYHSVTKERLTYDYIKMVGYRSGISIAYSLLRDNKIPVPYKISFFSNKLTRIRYKEINRGMLFLREQFRDNDEIKKWIRQKDYLGNNGIIPTLR